MGTHQPTYIESYPYFVVVFNDAAAPAPFRASFALEGRVSSRHIFTSQLWNTRYTYSKNMGLPSLRKGWLLKGILLEVASDIGRVI